MSRAYYGLLTGRPIVEVHMVDVTISTPAPRPWTLGRVFPVTDLASVFTHAQRRALRAPVRSRAFRRWSGLWCAAGVLAYHHGRFHLTPLGRGLREDPPVWRLDGRAVRGWWS